VDITTKNENENCGKHVYTISGIKFEFLDVNLSKDSSLLLHAVHSPFYWRILRRTILYSGYKNTFKKSANKRKLEFVHE
jgi:hypothetical protein